MPISKLNIKKLIVIALFITSCSTEASKEEEKQEEKHEAIIENKKELPTNYQYEPAISIITGTLTKENFWCPPTFGEDTLSDKKEICPILLIDNPITIKADSSDVVNETKTNVSKIQLLTNLNLENYFYKKLLVKGKLFCAQTGHHHTEVLISATEINLSP